MASIDATVKPDLKGLPNHSQEHVSEPLPACLREVAAIGEVLDDFLVLISLVEDSFVSDDGERASSAFEEAIAPSLELPAAVVAPGRSRVRKHSRGSSSAEEILEETRTLSELRSERNGNNISLMGDRKGLRGEKILCEVEKCFQLTNYRLLVHQEHG